MTPVYSGRFIMFHIPHWPHSYVQSKIFLVWNNEPILCGEATETHRVPLMFSVSLVDVHATVYDSSVSDVKTFVRFSFDRKTEWLS